MISRRYAKIRLLLLGWITLSNILPLISTITYADNCGSLSDCFNGLLIPAILVVLGLVIVIGVVMYLPVILTVARALVFRAFLGSAGLQMFGRRGVEKAAEIARSPGLQNLITKSMNYANKAAKINHIFGKVGHNLDRLIEKFGSQQKLLDKVFEQVYRSGKMPKVGTHGEFDIIVEGINLTVRGYTNKAGIFKLGSMFIK